MILKAFKELIGLQQHLTEQKIVNYKLSFSFLEFTIVRFGKKVYYKTLFWVSRI
jgi:hypothetical protein